MGHAHPPGQPLEMTIIGAWILRISKGFKLNKISHEGWTNAPSDLAAFFSDGLFTTMRLRSDPVQPVGLSLHLARLASTIEICGLRALIP